MGHRIAPRDKSWFLTILHHFEALIERDILRTIPAAE
jgi:hypothetical protein